MQDLRTYTYDELLGMEGQEIQFRTPLSEQVKVDNTFIYKVEKVKVRGQRGLFAFIDFFNDANENIGTMSVFMDSKIKIYDTCYPEFKIMKK